jgi:L-fuculokinase
MQCDLLASQHAGWQGVTLNTTRGHFYRAALEGLAEQLAHNLQTLEQIGHFKARELLLVGGGSRNALWNRSKPTGWRSPSKYSMTPKPPSPARHVWLVWRRRIQQEQARAQVSYRYRYFYPQTEPELIEGV